MKIACSRRNRWAFTIIEVLVASAILMGIIFAIYSSWTAIMRASKVALDVAAKVQRARIAVRAVEDALVTAQNFADNAQYYSFITDTQDENFHYLSLTARLPPTNFPGSGLFGDQIVRRVTFEVQQDEDGDNQLVMTQIPILLLTNDVVQPYPIVLVRDLSLFFLEFWDQRRGEWMAEFTATNQLPSMMRVTIGWGRLANRPTEPAEIITRTVALAGQIVPLEIQRPMIGGQPGGNQPPRGGNPNTRPGGGQNTRPGG